MTFPDDIEANPDAMDPDPSMAGLLDQPNRQPAVQRYEDMPDWVREELEQGSSLELRVKLRKALCAAQRECSGLVLKSGENKEQKYKYLGHEGVIEAVRDAMAKNGISVDQPLIEMEREVVISTQRGDSVRWVWRVLVLVTHEEGGALLRIVRPMTMANDKASFVARTAADRTVLMTLMRLAGANEDPENDSQEHAQDHGRPAQQGQGAQQKGGQPAQQQTGPRSLNATERGALTKLVREIHGVGPNADLDTELVDRELAAYRKSADKPDNYQVTVEDYKALHMLLSAKATRARQDRSAEGRQ